eukprot:1051597-Pelagomonas_calceolata.AAC.2
MAWGPQSWVHAVAGTQASTSKVWPRAPDHAVAATLALTSKLWNPGLGARPLGALFLGSWVHFLAKGNAHWPCSNQPECSVFARSSPIRLRCLESAPCHDGRLLSPLPDKTLTQSAIFGQGLPADARPSILAFTSTAAAPYFDPG